MNCPGRWLAWGSQPTGADYCFGAAGGAGLAGAAAGRFEASAGGVVTVRGLAAGAAAGLVAVGCGVVEGMAGGGLLCCSFCSNTLVVRV